MNVVDTVLVALIIIGATIFLCKVFMPKKDGKGCGCGSVDCKVAKPKLDRKKE